MVAVGNGEAMPSPDFMSETTTGLRNFGVLMITRGSIFGGVYQSISEDNMKQLNVTWIWFWFNIEFDVAFTIGCLVSFRALYTDKGASAKRAKLRERQKQAVEYTPSEYTPSKPTVGGSKCSGLRVKTQALQNVLLTTFQEWEDTTTGKAMVRRPLHF
ncbi:hypothetical protein LA080_009908 [Diaporthe eres]|nr:hypothetical protein LA080_009908 [Diaporthe eres]